MPAPVVEVRDLRTHLVTRWGTIRAVDGVSFSVAEGETLGLVGESGSGKSMTCLSLVRLHPRPAARILGGQVLLDGDDLLARSDADMTRIRGRKVAMILQDPMSSLNPVFSIGMQVREPVAMYHGLRGRSLTERAAELQGLPRGHEWARALGLHDAMYMVPVLGVLLVLVLLAASWTVTGDYRKLQEWIKTGQ